MWFPSQNLSKPSNSATCFNNLVRELCQPDTWALVALHLLSCPLKHKHLWKKYKTFYFSFWMLLPQLWQVGGLSLASGLQCFWVCSGTVGPTQGLLSCPCHTCICWAPHFLPLGNSIFYISLYISAWENHFPSAPILFTSTCMWTGNYPYPNMDKIWIN